MKRVIDVILVVATPLLLRADDGDDVHKELKASEGKWTAGSLHEHLSKECSP